MALLEFFCILWQLSFKGFPWLSFSVAQNNRFSKALIYGWVPSLLLDATGMQRRYLQSLSLLSRAQSQCMRRGYSVVYKMVPPLVCDWAVMPCLHTCSVFLQEHSLLWSSFHSLRLSSHSQQWSSPCDCAPVSMLQLPDTALSDGLASQSWTCKAAVQIICVALTPFRLSWISCFTLWQPQMLLLCPNQLSQCQDLTPSQIPPHLQVQVRFPLTLLLFSPSFFHPTEFCMHLLSSGALWELLYLRIYSWCICGERCTPLPPIPLSFCISHWHFFKEDIDMANRYMKRCSTSLITYKENVHQTTMRYHLISFKMAFIFKKSWQVFVKLRRKRESPWIAGENVNWCSHLGKQYEDSSKKIRSRTVICSRYPTSGYLSKIILNNLKRYRPAMFTAWLSHWGVHLQWGRPGFDPWVGKIS